MLVTVAPGELELPEMWIGNCFEVPHQECQRRIDCGPRPYYLMKKRATKSMNARNVLIHNSLVTPKPELKKRIT